MGVRAGPPEQDHASAVQSSAGRTARPHLEDFPGLEARCASALEHGQSGRLEKEEHVYCRKPDHSHVIPCWQQTRMLGQRLAVQETSSAQQHSVGNAPAMKQIVTTGLDPAGSCETC